jgi:hypothetical protein
MTEAGARACRGGGGDDPHPLLILTAGLRVRKANRAFHKHFHTTPEGTENVW